MFQLGFSSYSNTDPTADDGFLRLSAGGGSNAVGKSYIDISGYSTIPDMHNNIVFGTLGSEKMRITLLGDVGIGITNPAQKLDVFGNIKASGSVQVGPDPSAVSAANVGAIRYRTFGNNSYMDMVMQTGASTYAWVNVVQNNW